MLHFDAWLPFQIISIDSLYLLFNLMNLVSIDRIDMPLGHDCWYMNFCFRETKYLLRLNSTIFKIVYAFLFNYHNLGSFENKNSKYSLLFGSQMVRGRMFCFADKSNRID